MIRSNVDHADDYKTGYIHLKIIGFGKSLTYEMKFPALSYKLTYRVGMCNDESE